MRIKPKDIINKLKGNDERILWKYFCSKISLAPLQAFKT